MIHFRRNPRARKQDILGLRLGAVTVIRILAHPYCEVECEFGHKTKREATHLRRFMLGKEPHVPRCAECTRLERERKQAHRMGWPLEPEGAE